MRAGWPGARARTETKRAAGRARSGRCASGPADIIGVARGAAQGEGRARMESEPIRVFVTGGTFDKEYNELDGRLFFQDTHVPEMLRLGRCLLDAEVRELMMIDSLDMNEDDRRAIAAECRNAGETRIVITHGTDTMVETAAHLGREIQGKTIVLTGAMIPYKFGS